MTKIDNALAQKMANAIRFLSIDAVQKAKSGHPGMPMGMADMATILFSEFLNFNAKDPHWINRDRFILSAGHGSMLIYALLYLTGFEDINLDDIKNFRQLGSKCAGHPEFGHIEGIETTTGPLGQGISTAVGMAISEKMLKARIGEDLIDHKIYTIAGDGCLMEGICQEAISLAGNLNLNNLVVIWDNNSISIDGKTDLATNENMHMRFEACGFEVISCDGHDFDDIRKALSSAQDSTKPVMIDCKTTIGFGSPNKANSEKAHGSPLGEEEIIKTRENLNWPYQEFEVPDDVLNEFRKAGIRSQNIYQEWQENFAKNEKSAEIERIKNKKLPADFAAKLAEFKQDLQNEKPSEASRKSSNRALEFLTKELPELIGGSADLTGSVLTKTSSTNAINKNDFSQRYLHYGIREHVMGAVMSGIALHSGLIPFGGTFLVFSDYMKPAIRLAALMKQQVIYIFTHDSIGLGEDGPTHQPIEHLAMLRAIPNLNVFRPADAEETIESFAAALEDIQAPSAMIFSRQGLPFLNKASECNIAGYVVKEAADSKATIIATGSEVSLAIEAQEILAKENIAVRVVSIASFEKFASLAQSEQEKLLGSNLRIGVEAAIEQGWRKYLGQNGIFIGMDDFGASAKAEDLFEHFNITAKNICQKIRENI